MKAPIEKTYIIAEAGVNHNGSSEMAFQLVDAAIDARANAVKFQTFRADSLVSEFTEKASYQKQATDSEETQLEMLRQLELGHELHHQLHEYCKDRNIDFLSTAFDSESLHFLLEGLGLKKLKIPSGEITNAPLVLEHARAGCDLIVSTGMAALGEVESILGVIAFGLTAAGDETPSREAFIQAYLSASGQEALRDNVTLLHCTTEYPAPFADINLAAMDTLRQAFGLPVGYSDHSEGIAVSVAAVARGARLIEKHFTLDKTLPGPDHKASLDPGELKSMVDSIRSVEAAIGDGVKGPRSSEVKNMAVARKSLVAAEDIAKGTVFSVDNLAIKRPGNGISPMEYWDLLGTRSRFDFKKGEVIFD